MDKKEIKKDLILEKILNLLNFITENINQTLGFVSIFVLVVVGLVLYANKSESKNLSYNAYSSSNMNNFIDDNKDLAVIGFENMLATYNSSESYNQAYLYLLSDAMDKNDYDKLGELINNNKFSSDDPTLNSHHELIKGNYYSYLSDYDQAISSYEKALDYSVEENLSAKINLNLIYIYIDLNQKNNALKIFSDISVENLSYDLKNKYDELDARLSF